MTKQFHDSFNKMLDGYFFTGCDIDRCPIDQVPLISGNLLDENCGYLWVWDFGGKPPKSSEILGLSVGCVRLCARPTPWEKMELRSFIEKKCEKKQLNKEDVQALAKDMGTCDQWVGMQRTPMGRLADVSRSCQRKASKNLDASWRATKSLKGIPGRPKSLSNRYEGFSDLFQNFEDLGWRLGY